MATLGEQAVGSIVKLNVNGVAKNFRVVHQGLPGSMYDASCDGTWLLMKSSYTSMKWDATNNDYANSDIHSYLNNTFLNLFDDDIKNTIKQVKIPYTSGTGSGGSIKTGSEGLSAKVFLLSAAETRQTHKNANVEGAALGYTEFIDIYNSLWWTRSPNNNRTNIAWALDPMGFSGLNVSQSAGVLPAIILPRELEVAEDGSVVILNRKAITGKVIINSVQRELTGEGYANINGVLRDLSDSQVNIGGTLKSLKG
jgi:hypothetical protein